MTLGTILKMDVVTDAEEATERALFFQRQVDIREQVGPPDQWGYRKWAVVGKRDPTDDEIDQHIDLHHNRAGTVRKATVMPLGVSSRWRQHGWNDNSPLKRVTLTANAMSMVKAPEVG